MTITNTNKNKTLRLLFGYESNNSTTNNSYAWVGMQSGLWMNTNGISTIVISGGTINQYSTFALYGITGK